MNDIENCITICYAVYWLILKHIPCKVVYFKMTKAIGYNLCHFHAHRNIQ